MEFPNPEVTCQEIFSFKKQEITIATKPKILNGDTVYQIFFSQRECCQFSPNLYVHGSCLKSQCHSKKTQIIYNNRKNKETKILTKTL